MSMQELSPIHQAILNKFGKIHWIRFSKSLNSIINRLAHIEYHIDELKRIEFDAGASHATIDSVREIYRRRDPRLYDLGIKASAHTIAAIQALHSISDITGTAIALARNSKTEWSGYLHDHLSDKTLEPELSNLIAMMQNNDNYRYLAAATNESKHSNIVNAAFTVQLESGLPNGYYFSSFQRFDKSKKVWKDYWPLHIRTFIQSEYERQTPIILSILDVLDRRSSA